MDDVVAVAVSTGQGSFATANQWMCHEKGNQINGRDGALQLCRGATVV